MLREITTQENPTAENLLERLSDLENNPEESLTPYEEFETTLLPADSFTGRIHGPKRRADFSAATLQMRSGTTGLIVGGSLG